MVIVGISLMTDTSIWSRGFESGEPGNILKISVDGLRVSICIGVEVHYQVKAKSKYLRSRCKNVKGIPKVKRTKRATSRPCLLLVVPGSRRLSGPSVYQPSNTPNKPVKSTICSHPNPKPQAAHHRKVVHQVEDQGAIIKGTRKRTSLC